MDHKIVLVDICGTLYDANTTMTFLDYSFAKNRKYRMFRKLSKTTLSRVLNTLIFRSFGYDCIRYLGIRFLRGITKIEMMKLVNRYYENFLRNKIQFEPIRILKDYQCRTDCHIVIVSATLDCIACKVAEKIGIDNYLSSQLAYKDGVCCGSLKTDLLCNKLMFLRRFGYEYPYKMTMSDNLSDAELMCLSEENYIVTNTTRLRKWQKIIDDKRIHNYKFVLVK